MKIKIFRRHLNCFKRFQAIFLLSIILTFLFNYVKKNKSPLPILNNRKEIKEDTLDCYSAIDKIKIINTNKSYLSNHPKCTKIKDWIIVHEKR